MKAFLSKIWAKLSAFAKAHPVWAVEIGILLLVFGMGVLAGYKLFHKPPSIEYKDKLVEDVVSKQQLELEKQHSLELQKQIEVLTATNEDLKKHQKIVKHEVDKPDGTKTIDTTVVTNTDDKKSTNTDTKTKVDEKVADKTDEKKVDESSLHLTDEKSKTITQQGSSPFSATASFGYEVDFGKPSNKGNMYTGLTLSYDVIWIFGVSGWVHDPLNNPTSPSIGAEVYIDFAKLFGMK